MKNAVIFCLICLFLLIALFIGLGTDSHHKTSNSSIPDDKNIPHIGKIEVLNGCGIPGASREVAGYLRSKQFDVKNMGNAVSWNYPFTIVVSRTKDMHIANRIAKELKTDKIILLRLQNAPSDYDVTIFLGPDYRERIQ